MDGVSGETSEEAGGEVTAVVARRDSRLRTAGFTDASKPELTREVRYNWKATSERKSGEPGSYPCNAILYMWFSGRRIEWDVQIRTCAPISSRPNHNQPYSLFESKLQRERFASEDYEAKHLHLLR